MIEDTPLERGFVAPDVHAEFPELALVYTTVAARRRRSPDELRRRLSRASDRFTGARAIALRQQPIPWAYRVFFRHIGIDPDERRIPVEAIAVERLRAGGFKPTNNVDDALLLATLETGVALQAFGAESVVGPVGIRLARDGELLGADARPLASGQLLIADSERPLALLFGAASERHLVAAQAERILLAAVQVKGVPDISVDEALWIATEVLLG